MRTPSAVTNRIEFWYHEFYFPLANLATVRIFQKHHNNFGNGMIDLPTLTNVLTPYKFQKLKEINIKHLTKVRKRLPKALKTEFIDSEIILN